MKNPVFILGLFDTGYYAARLLKDESLTIFGFDYNSSNPGFYSNFIQPFIIPHPLKDPDGLLRIIIQKRKEFNIYPILIASSEIYLFFVHTYRNELEKHFLFLLPHEFILSRILNKAEQFKMAEKLSINVPHYRVVNDPNKLDNLADTFKYPVIIKGLDQAVWKSEVDKKAYISTCKEELINIIHDLNRKVVPFIVQEFIHGEVMHNYEYNAFMVDGKIIECNMVQKLYQYPVNYGAACCVKSIINKDVEMLGSKFVLENNIEGFSNTEFKFEPATGIYYFIETNSRVWLQIEMTRKLGQNYLHSYYNYLANNIAAIGNAKKHYEQFWLDLPSFLILILKHWKKLNINAFEVLISLIKASNYGLISITDPCPFMKTVIFKKRKK